jgi:hypothetical protein
MSFCKIKTIDWNLLNYWHHSYDSFFGWRRLSQNSWGHFKLIVCSLDLKVCKISVRRFVNTTNQKVMMPDYFRQFSNLPFLPTTYSIYQSSVFYEIFKSLSMSFCLGFRWLLILTGCPDLQFHFHSDRKIKVRSLANTHSKILCFISH